MNPLEILVAAVVPVRLLKVIEAFTRPPGTPVPDEVTGIPDTWLPPLWVSNDRLGEQHPCKGSRV